MNNMLFNAEDTLCIAIDYQEKLVPAMNDNQKLINNSVKLIKGLNILNVPVIFSQQYTKGLGMTVNEIMDAYEKDDQSFEYFDKKKFSCYEDDAIKEDIYRAGKNNIIICGMETHICVLQTAIGLKEKGYNVMIITDCVSSRTKENSDIGIERAKQEGILIGTYESILFELTKGADMAGFKEISKLVK